MIIGYKTFSSYSLTVSSVSHGILRIVFNGHSQSLISASVSAHNDQVSPLSETYIHPGWDNVDESLNSLTWIAARTIVSSSVSVKYI